MSNFVTTLVELLYLDLRTVHLSNINSNGDERECVLYKLTVCIVRCDYHCFNINVNYNRIDPPSPILVCHPFYIYNIHAIRFTRVFITDGMVVVVLFLKKGVDYRRE